MPELTILQAKVPMQKGTDSPPPKHFRWRRASLSSVGDLHTLIRGLLDTPKEAIVLGEPAATWKQAEWGLRRSRDSEDSKATLLPATVSILPVDVDGYVTKQWADPMLAAREALRTLEVSRETPCVWSATGSAGLKAGEARLRLWIPLRRPVRYAECQAWAEQWDWTDGSIYAPASLIYTARPAIDPDPYPGDARCGVLNLETAPCWSLPGAKSGKSAKSDSKGIDKPAKDLIVQKLHEKGLYLQELDAGRHAIRCPWESEHSTPTEEGDTATIYMQPHWSGHAKPSFKCLHQHCANRGMDDLRQALGTVTQKARFAEWDYVTTLRVFVNRRTNLAYRREAYDELYLGHIDKGRPSTEWLKDPKMQPRKCDTWDFLPGEPRHVTRANGRALNSWTDRRLAPVAGDAGPWVEHLAALVASPEERQILEQWIAWVYRRPGQRIKWAPVLVGVQGNGKTTTGEILAELVGQAHVSRPTTSDIKGRFNGWAFGKEFCLLEELMSGGHDPHSIANSLKPLIANDIISVREMYRPAFDATNAASFMACTNHYTALSVNADDRRYMFIRTGRPDPPRLRRLWTWLKDENGFAIIGGHLKGVDLTDFPVNGPAPHTVLRDMTIETTQSGVGEMMWHVKLKFEHRRIVASDQVTEHLADGGFKTGGRAVGHVAMALGWMKLKRGSSGRRRVTLYATSAETYRQHRAADFATLLSLADEDEDSEDLLS